MPCCRRVFNPMLYLTINLSVCGRILKMFFEFYDIYNRAVAAYLKVVRRREPSSAEDTRGGEHERGIRPFGGLPEKIFEF